LEAAAGGERRGAGARRRGGLDGPGEIPALKGTYMLYTIT
jgi:hypothetical protein